MSEIIVYLLVALIFLAAGAAAGFWLGQKRGREDAARSSDVQKEFDAYRQQVTEHFGETADHFQALGKQVRHLYDHMAEGAETLCTDEGAGQAIEFPAAGALTAAAAGADAAEKKAEEPEASDVTAEPPDDEETEAKDAAAEPDGEASDKDSSTDAEAPKDYASDHAPGDETVKRVETADAGASFAVASGEDDPRKRSYH